MKDVVAMDRMEELTYVSHAPPPVYHEADYVKRTWLEHKIHHTYPEPGGYNDQDEWLMRDWHTLNLYYSRVTHDDFMVDEVDDTATPWQQMARG